MSAYVVEDKTINRILSFMLSNCPEFVDNPLNFEGGCKTKAVQRLGERMRALNEDSVNWRYDDPDMIPNKPFQFFDVPTTAIQAVKSLSCFLYQSCEGDNDNTDLYKRLQKFKRDLCVDIVNDLPEYESAFWG